MRIGIYADFPEGKYGGIQQYVEKLVKALVENSSHTIVVITSPKLYSTFFNELTNHKNFEVFITSRKQFLFKTLFYNRYTRIISEKVINGIPFISRITMYLGNIKPRIYDLKLDVIHFPLQNMPIYNWSIPSLISMHDLQQEYFPENFTKMEIYLRNLHFKKSARECDQIIVSFNHVKNDIIKFYNIPAENITSTSLGAENRFEGLTVIDKNELLSRFKIPEDFIFYPAQTWKHKNHLGLLKAILQIREQYNTKVYLVCSGRKSSYYNELEIFIEDNNLQDQVSFLGFISIQELYSLYRYTALVVIPTIYEAGSFPLFEAMSIGSPVICSRTTSLPETIGDDRFTFDPKSIEEMESKIMEMLNSIELKRKNIENSNLQIKRFTWDVVIKNFENAYSIAIKNFNSKQKH